LTTGVIVDVPAGNVLLLSTPTVIPEFNNMNKSGLKVYPNPLTDKSILEILPPLAGDAINSVCDMTGKVLTQYKGYVENYTQEFNLSGIKNGLYIITVHGNGYQFSEKLLSNGKSIGTASITRASNNMKAISEKKSLIESKGVMANVDMSYNAGERLKFTAVSGNNSTVTTDIPTTDKTITFAFTECKDGDNNYYPVVQIGTQLWMAENLKTTKYQNVESIGTTNPYDKDISIEIEPKYQWAYAGNESNVAAYGRLYTWYAVTDSRKICPTGWHMPSDDEWTTLENYLIINGFNYDGTTTGNNIAKSLASTALWISSSTAGAVGNADYPAKRDATGFTALPGGVRGYSGSFSFLGSVLYLWSATENNATYASHYLLNYNISYVYKGITFKKYGLSVRCVKD